MDPRPVFHVLLRRADGLSAWCRPLYGQGPEKALEVARIIFDNAGHRGGELSVHSKRFRTKGELERRRVAAEQAARRMAK